MEHRTDPRDCPMAETMTLTRADLDRMGYDIVDGVAVRKGVTLDVPIAVHIPDPIGEPVSWLPPPDPTLPLRNLVWPIERPSIIAEGGRQRPWAEKDEQRECWRLLLGLGFAVEWLSQPAKSWQTPGIPDLYARHATRRLLVWVEVKRPNDPEEWKPAQQAFALRCIPGMETYVLGSEANLRDALTRLGCEVPR